MKREWLNRFLCWMGLHDWYHGITKAYCTRKGCGAELDILYQGPDV